uniref:Uncharacterized protein n=1 Tax=Myoviridae sp. ctp4Q36 TaxID=2827708 RepID=A0A8S5T1Z8_9CAUD|nr:MAG TPA: hypothetical protein [Myoviridae sp. ctp4Q36]
MLYNESVGNRLCVCCVYITQESPFRGFLLYNDLITVGLYIRR